MGESPELDLGFCTRGMKPGLMFWWTSRIRITANWLR